MPIRTYEDFDLAIEGVATGYRAKVLRSPGGEGTTYFAAPFSDAELLKLSVAISSDGADRHVRPAPSVTYLLDPQRVGERLFTVIFRDAVDICLRYSLKAVERPQQGLRIRLHLNDAGKLADLPWEYLYDPVTYGFFALSDRTPIVRYIELTQGAPPSATLRVRGALRILTVIASPQDERQLDTKTEWQQLQTAFAQKQTLVTLERLGQATLPALQNRLLQPNDPVHILHFIGHGAFGNELRKGLLLFEDADHQASPVTANVLGTLLRDCDALCLVFLNACEGARSDEGNLFAGVAHALIRNGIAAVIAMQYAIGDQSAIQLAATFYAALSEGYPVDAALVHARKHLYGQSDPARPTLSTRIEWGTPVLFMRTPDGLIWNREIEHEQIIATLDRFQTRAEAMTGAGHVDQMALLANGLRHFSERLRDRINEAATYEQGEPYRGLLAYRIGDSRRFFGRDQAIQAFLNRLHSSSLTVLHAESGAGKTSLIQAGLLPRLIADGHLAVSLRPYDKSPALALKQTLMPDLGIAAGLASAPLRDFVRSISRMLGDKANLYVFLDQFEEFFTQAPADVQAHFIDEWYECLTDESLNTYWIIAIRTEYFGNLANLRPRIRNPYANDFRLNRLTRAEAQEVIVRPAALYNLRFEDTLIETLLNELGRDQILPPQLQLVCRALYEGLLRSGQTVITQALYTELGGVAEILRDHLARVVHDHFPNQLRSVVQRLLEALVTAHQQRALCTKAALTASLTRQNISATQVEEILAVLKDNHLVREQEATPVHPEPTYELAHDYLLEEIVLSPEARARKAAEELLSRSLLTLRDAGSLMDGKTLRIVFAQREQLDISAESTDLLVNSAFETGVDLADWLAFAPPLLAQATLLKALNRPEAELRRRAIEHLQPFYTPAIVGNIAQLAKTDADRSVRAAALHLLGEVAPDQARMVSLSELTHSSLQRRLDAMRAAELYVDAEIVNALFERIIAGDHRTVCEQALALLAARRAEPYRQHWQPLLRASFWQQEAAFTALRAQHVRLPFVLKMRWAILHLVRVVLDRLRTHRRLVAAMGGILLAALLAVWLQNWWLARPWQPVAGAPPVSLTALALTDEHIYIGSRDCGLKIKRIGQDQWTDWLDWQPANNDGTPPMPCTVAHIKAFAIDSQQPEQIYAHVWGEMADNQLGQAVFRLDRHNQQWTPIGASIFPTGTETGVTSLAVHAGQVLLAAGEEGLFTWPPLANTEQRPAGIFDVVAFDAAGTPYAGGEDGLYRGGLGDPSTWAWERLPQIPQVEHLAFGLESTLYLGMGLDRQAHQYGCYQLEEKKLWSDELYWNLFSPNITAIAAHPTIPGRFYVGYSDSRVYEVTCGDNEERFLGKVAGLRLGVAALGVIATGTGEFMLMQANDRGLYARSLSNEQGGNQ